MVNNKISNFADANNWILFLTKTPPSSKFHINPFSGFCEILLTNQSENNQTINGQKHNITNIIIPYSLIPTVWMLHIFSFTLNKNMWFHKRSNLQDSWLMVVGPIHQPKRQSVSYLQIGGF